MTATLQDAVKMARKAHLGQVDKIGLPYILHPIAVMNDPSLTTEIEKMVAVLHDVVEDTEYEVEDLVSYGVEVQRAVQALTHKKGDSYAKYLEQVARNNLALKVKLADIRHNTSSARMKNLPPPVRERLTKKYTRALQVLQQYTDKY